MSNPALRQNPLVDRANIVDLDLGSDYLRQNALPELCATWARNPPFYVENNGLLQAVVGRAADVKAVLEDTEHFVTKLPEGPGYERFDFFNGAVTVAQLEGKEHARVRMSMMPSFVSGGFLNKFEISMQAIITEMLDGLGNEFDAMEDFANHLVVRNLLDALLGMSPEQQKVLIRMHDAFSLVVDLAPGEAHPPAYLQAQQDAFMVIMEMIAERRARPRELDFISGMIASQEKHGINDDQELIANIFAVIGAGQGTTSTATGTMLMLLCQNPEQFDKVKADPSLIPQAVEEALRMHGAGFFTFPRFAKQDVEIGGVMIFKDMPVNMSMLSANLDPTEYADPLRFDVMRNPKHIMSFGSGPHHCIGNRMARRIMAATLEQICQRFPNLHLQDPNYKPVYGGMYGELKPLHIPMRLC